jgi:hypothetical protein
MTCSKLLEATAITIYGPRWKAPLARDLGVPQQVLSHWIKEPPPPQHRLWGALTLALGVHASHAIELLKQMEEVEAGSGVPSAGWDDFESTTEQRRIEAH